MTDDSITPEDDVLSHTPRADTSTRFLHPHSTRTQRDYAPSFFDGDFIDETHASLVTRLADVRGKLEDADHFKLYEAGYFARGPILEIGRLAAKSTVCLALGARAGSSHVVYSIEQEHKYLQTAVDTLNRFGVVDQVTLIQGDSALQSRRIPAPLDTIFVDGDHSYLGVMRDIEALADRVSRGGVLMFHDYYHHANAHAEYGVQRAVDEVSGLAFRGRFGGIAMFECVDRLEAEAAP